MCFNCDMFPTGLACKVLFAVCYQLRELVSFRPDVLEQAVNLEFAYKFEIQRTQSRYCYDGGVNT